MAKISKADLVNLTNDEIKTFFVSEDISAAPDVIRKYVEDGKQNYTMGIRINRVEKLLMEIVTSRFIKDQL